MPPKRCQMLRAPKAMRILREGFNLGRKTDFDFFEIVLRDAEKFHYPKKIFLFL